MGWADIGDRGVKTYQKIKGPVPNQHGKWNRKKSKSKTTKGGGKKGRFCHWGTVGGGKGTRKCSGWLCKAHINHGNNNAQTGNGAHMIKSRVQSSNRWVSEYLGKKCESKDDLSKKGRKEVGNQGG